ncbi:hypothetical protein [Draconibacterium sp.]|uniref:hypothetical protein n=1 Tax=Draconibacterium sp. TaxID=1965318 RepID=UPI003567DDF5
MIDLAKEYFFDNQKSISEIAFDGALSNCLIFMDVEKAGRNIDQRILSSVNILMQCVNITRNFDFLAIFRQ